MTRRPPARRFAAALLLGAAAAPAALAHGGAEVHGPTRPHDWAELWRTWGLEPGVLIPLALANIIATAVFLEYVASRFGFGG